MIRRTSRVVNMLSAAVLVLVMAPFASSQAGVGVHRMELGQAEGPSGGIAALPIQLTTNSQVQGLVAVVEWDETALEGVELRPGAILADADVLVQRVEPGYLVLGAVLDADGQGGEIINPGEGLNLATARLRCLAGVDGDESIPVSFAEDGEGYSAVEGGPMLDNQFTVGGLSIERPQGLELVNGEVRCLEGARATLRIESTVASVDTGCAGVPIRLDHPSDDVEGYELSIVHPAGLTLEEISIEGTDAAQSGADFAQADVFQSGGTLGVVLDLQSPFEGNTIPAGLDSTIAIYSYCCERSAETQVFDIRFEDGLGAPAKENTVVVGGQALIPITENGTFTCGPMSGEDCDDGEDNDGDGLVDCDDPDCEDSLACNVADQSVTCGDAELAKDGLPFSASGAVGGTAQVSFFYRSPDVPGSGADQIQGMSMGICYPCELQCSEGSLDVTDTIVEAIGAEFLSQQCDNDPDDGDGCEMIIGILVDAMPPFEGQTLPPTDRYFRIGTVEFTVEDDSALCGRCFPIDFCDGINGRGIVPVRNLVSIENFSRPLQVIGCDLCVESEERFYRGDCNFSGGGVAAVDVADVAATLSFLFLEGTLHFEAPCLDSCDANDDGRVDIADGIFTLRFLFQFGDFPPAPGPGFDRSALAVGPGIDPTEDPLDCGSGSGCDAF